MMPSSKKTPMPTTISLQPFLELYKYTFCKCNCYSKTMLIYDVFTIILLLLLSQTSISYNTFNKTRPISLSKWNNVSFKSNNGRIIYMDCTDNSRSNCTVTAEKTIHSNDSYSCNILNSDNREMTQFELQGSLDSEKIVLLWREFLKNQYTFKFGILQMKNCTLDVPTFEIELLEKPAINLHESGFNVFFKNVKLCGKKLCRTSFDNDGRMLKPTHGYVEDNCSHIKPLASNLSKESLFYFCADNTQDENMHERSSLGWIKFSEVFDTNNNYFKHPMRDGFYLITADGNKTFLAEDNGKSFTSTAHGLISICAIYDSYINCSQFNVQGHLKFNRILAGGVDDYIEIMDIHNLSQGGFLLLLKEYWDCSEKNGLRDMCHHVTLGKFDRKGKIVGSTVVEGYYGAKMDMYEDEDGNYCTLSSHAKKSSIFWGEKKVNFSYKCFNVSDLSQRPFRI